jgi:hypothetical protein
MLSGNKLFVPPYQRAYSWETEVEPNKLKKHTNVFLSDLEDHCKSLTKAQYYFGHFLFEENNKSVFAVIDGQQRLTTIVIFLSALFKRLKEIRQLNEEELECFEDIIKRNSTYRFETVDYDSQLFKDYVVNQTKKDNNGLDTESSKRIVKAFNYFSQYLSNKEESYLTKILKSIKDATCTTHTVSDESEAIQMFIFQNNRGKKPSNLEIIKAQFMFNVHLYGDTEKEDLNSEIKNRFEKIYKSISSIEYQIDEDDVLLFTLRVHFNSLWESNAIEKINEILTDGNPIQFIKSFTHSLAISFDYLSTFFGKHERENIEIHSLIALGGINIAIPFIIKSYKFGLPISEICHLCSSLESLILRHRLIGTRADLTSRISEAYKDFSEVNKSVQTIVDKIDFLKTTNDWWWSYWNNDELKKSIQGGVSHSTAKYLLWKYENYLENQGKSGYSLSRYDKIVDPELEHIAPQTPTNGEPVASGYPAYDEEFINQYIDCLGNYLLLSKSHNCSVGNQPFEKKRSSYNHLAQQREIQQLTMATKSWSKELINVRKTKIVDFILTTF